MEKKDCIQEEGLYKGQLLALNDALALLSGKWKFILLLNLRSYGSLRFKDLQEVTLGISAKVLSKELQELEAHFFIIRTVNKTKPVTVTYELTPYAFKAEPVIMALINFGLEHRATIKGNFKQQSL
jgi:DNA-binding HxlR family transcriptional regulator